MVRFDSMQNQCPNYKVSFKLQGNDNIMKEGNKILQNDLDPNVVLCPYDLSGVCADDSCTFQHLKNKNNNQQRNLNQDTSILENKTRSEMGAFMKSCMFQLPELELPCLFSSQTDKNSETSRKRKVKCNNGYQTHNIRLHDSIDEAGTHPVKDKSAKKRIKAHEEKKENTLIITKSDLDQSIASGTAGNTDSSDSKQKIIKNDENIEVILQNDIAIDEESDFIALPEIKDTVDGNKNIYDQIKLG